MRVVLSILITALIVAGGGFVLICALLYFGQESSIFFPRPNDAQLRQRYRSSSASRSRRRDAMLEGWWVENAQATTPAVILYFGGNAEDVLYTASDASNIDARAVVVVNYRGYGGSTGEPSQKALTKTASPSTTTRSSAACRGTHRRHGTKPRLRRRLDARGCATRRCCDPDHAVRQSRCRRGRPLSFSAGAIAPATSVPVIRLGSAHACAGVVSRGRQRQRRSSERTRRSYFRSGQDRSRFTCSRRPATTTSRPTRTTTGSSTSFWRLRNERSDAAH